MTDEIRQQIHSPEVDGDSVTFRLKAPNANAVSVTGIQGHTDLAMKKESDGVWTLKLTNVAPELYSYRFDVDGTSIVDPSNRQVKKWLSLDSQFEVLGGLLHECHDVPHGVVQHRLLKTSVGRTQNCVIYFPPGFESSDRQHPVLFLLHGFGDDSTAWTEIGRVHLICDNLTSKGKCSAPVIVMPDGHPVPAETQADFDEYTGRNLLALKRELSNDLLPLVQEVLGAKLADDFSIAGLSMGGGQALGLGLDSEFSFRAIGAFSAATPVGDDNQISRQLNQKKSSAESWNQKMIFSRCGADDFLLDRVENFDRWLKDQGVTVDHRITPGEHHWFVWRQYIAEFLQKAYPVSP